MAKTLDVVLVVDLEATCWEGAPPEGQVSEILEIGICPVRVSDGQRLEKRSILVRPQASEISPFCTSLTTITPQMIESEGLALPDALRVLKKEYASKSRHWASWGDYDRRQFERECKRKGHGYPFGPGHLNLKTLFALLCGEPHELGTVQALEALGLEFEGTHHRGDDDAWNIGRILGHILDRARPMIG